MAEELRASEAAAKRRPANVHEKVGVRPRNEAARGAIAERWLGIHEITSTPPTGTAPQTAGATRTPANRGSSPPRPSRPDGAAQAGYIQRCRYVLYVTVG